MYNPGSRQYWEDLSSDAWVNLGNPIALQSSLLQSAGMGTLIEKLNWIEAYLLIGGGAMLMLYCAGVMVSSIVKG